MRRHVLLNNVTKIRMPDTVRGLDKVQWIDVFTPIRHTFKNSGIQIQIITRREPDTVRLSPSLNGKHYAEHEVEN